jgi:hypothetical protein
LENEEMNKSSKELVKLVMAIPLEDCVKKHKKFMTVLNELRADSDDTSDIGTFEIELNIDPNMVKEIDDEDPYLDTDQDSSNDEDFDLEYHDEYEEVESYGELCFLASMASQVSGHSGYQIGLTLSEF